ncbi:MAG: hypothetical protein NXY57DRAFT_968167 [Lentinula lateritia]|nr:MAG: hypothetical protein NXY57DRAFT_968167 [Lentinula lateritia]
MAATSSQTQAAVSTMLLPLSLLEAQVLLAGIQSKSTLSRFFESPVFQCLQAEDYSPPLLDSQHSPDYNGSGSFPAFTYPWPLLPFCFPVDTSRPLSVASGLDLYRSAQMAPRTLQSAMEDSNPTESIELYHIFEEAAPYLVRDQLLFIRRTNPANCHVLICPPPRISSQWLGPAVGNSIGAPIFPFGTLFLLVRF